MWLNSPPDERVSARSPTTGLAARMRLVARPRVGADGNATLHVSALDGCSSLLRAAAPGGRCRARAVEEIDLVVAERPRREAERDLAILGDANHSCHAPRGAAPRGRGSAVR